MITKVANRSDEGFCVLCVCWHKLLWHHQGWLQSLAQQLADANCDTVTASTLGMVQPPTLLWAGAYANSAPNNPVPDTNWGCLAFSITVRRISILRTNYVCRTQKRNLLEVSISQSPIKKKKKQKKGKEKNENKQKKTLLVMLLPIAWSQQTPGSLRLVDVNVILKVNSFLSKTERRAIPWDGWVGKDWRGTWDVWLVFILSNILDTNIWFPGQLLQRPSGSKALGPLLTLPDSLLRG